MSRCSVCANSLARPISWTYLGIGRVTPGLCQTCLDAFVRIKAPLCRHCGRGLTIEGEEKRCPDCVTWEGGPLIWNRSLAERNPWLTEVIYRFKYRYDYEVILGFQSLVQAAIKDCLDEQTAVVLVPVPLSQERLRVRKFNQALALAEMAGLKIDQCLSRMETEKQAKKSRQARFAASNPFRLAHLPAATTVLLIDDIYTTGVTLHHAAEVLHAAGVEKIYSFTLAR